MKDKLFGTLNPEPQLTGQLNVGVIVGPKGDPGSVDYSKVQDYIDSRFLLVFGDMNARINKVQSEATQKIKMLEWGE